MALTFTAISLFKKGLPDGIINLILEYLISDEISSDWIPSIDSNGKFKYRVNKNSFKKIQNIIRFKKNHGIVFHSIIYNDIVEYSASSFNLPINIGCFDETLRLYSEIIVGPNKTEYLYYASKINASLENSNSHWISSNTSQVLYRNYVSERLTQISNFNYIEFETIHSIENNRINLYYPESISFPILINQTVWVPGEWGILVQQNNPINNGFGFDWQAEWENDEDEALNFGQLMAFVGVH